MRILEAIHNGKGEASCAPVGRVCVCLFSPCVVDKAEGGGRERVLANLMESRCQSRILFFFFFSFSAVTSKNSFQAKKIAKT